VHVNFVHRSGIVWKFALVHNGGFRKIWCDFPICISNFAVRLISRSGHFNLNQNGIIRFPLRLLIHFLGPWAQRNLQSPYHFILDLASWKLILGSFVMWTVVNVIFGGIYYIDIENLGCV
jgi:hypothetical protein